MSNTIKGSKYPNSEFESRRLGNERWHGGVGSDAKFFTHRKERRQSKRIVREQSKEMQ